MPRSRCERRAGRPRVLLLVGGEPPPDHGATTSRTGSGCRCPTPTCGPASTADRGLAPPASREVPELDEDGAAPHRRTLGVAARRSKPASPAPARALRRGRQPRRAGPSRLARRARPGATRSTSTCSACAAASAPSVWRSAPCAAAATCSSGRNPRTWSCATADPVRRAPFRSHRPRRWPRCPTGDPLRSGSGRLGYACFAWAATFAPRPRWPPGRPARARGRLLLERAELVVELVDERHAGRDVELGDVVVGDAVEVLHERPQAVAVGGDEHRRARRRGRGRCRRTSTGACASTTSFRHSAAGQHVGRQVGVAAVVVGVDGFVVGAIGGGGTS